MDVTFQTSKGPSSGHYKGVLFWDVLQANKAFEGLEHNAELERVFVVTGADDYVIAFSVGEIHPDFGDTPMLLADSVDGKPLEGFRIVVPGDTRGAQRARRGRDRAALKAHRKQEGTMRLSARNQLKGTIVEVTKGATTSHVKIDIGDGVVVTASITNDAVAELKLKAGKAAYAVIKASDVMVAV